MEAGTPAGRSITRFSHPASSLLSLDIASDGTWRDSSSKYESTVSSGIFDYLLGRRGKAAAGGGSSAGGGGASSFTSASIVIKGKLYKRGSWRKNWKERVFILRRDSKALCYYKDEAHLELLGEVGVNESTRVWIETNPSITGALSGKVYYCFAVSQSPTGRVLYVRAPDKRTMISWYMAISGEIQAAKNQASGGREGVASPLPMTPGGTPSPHHQHVEEGSSGVEGTIDKDYDDEDEEDDDDEEEEGGGGGLSVPTSIAATMAEPKIGDDSQAPITPTTSTVGEEAKGGDHPASSSSPSSDPAAAPTDSQSSSSPSEEVIMEEEVGGRATWFNVRQQLSLVYDDDYPMHLSLELRHFPHPASEQQQQQQQASSQCLLFLGALWSRGLPAKESNPVNRLVREYLGVVGVDDADADGSRRGGPGEQQGCGGDMRRTLAGFDWVVMGRTENVAWEANGDEEVGRDEGALEGDAFSRSFSVLLRVPRVSQDKGPTYLLLGLFLGGDKDDDVASTRHLATTVTTFTALKESSTSADGHVMVLPMDIIRPVEAPEQQYRAPLPSKPEAQAAVVISLGCVAGLSRMVEETTSVLQGWPSLTRSYFHIETSGDGGGRSSSGGVMACQQIVIPRLGAVIPRALIDLMVKERIQAIRDLKQALRDVIVALSPLIQLLQDQQSLLVDYYLEAKDHCDWRLLTTSEESARRRDVILPPRLGGCLHRRSAFKKTPMWQFTPLNMCVQLMFIGGRHRCATSTMSTGEPSSASSSSLPSPPPPPPPPPPLPPPSSSSSHGVEEEEEDACEILPTLTLGSTAAHAWGFSHGGLRSMLLNAKGGARSSGAAAASVQDAMLTLNSYQVMWRLAEEAKAIPPEVLLVQEDVDRANMLKDLPSMKLLQSSLRADVVCSQCLTMAVTSLTTFIRLCSVSARHRHILPRVLQAGYMVSVQSLLTTAGHEQGMIEDLAAGVAWLSTVTVRLLIMRRGAKQEKVATEQASRDGDDGGVGGGGAVAADGPRQDEGGGRSSSPGGGPEARHVGRCESVSIWRRKGDRGRLVVDITFEKSELSVVMATRELYGIPLGDETGDDDAPPPHVEEGEEASAAEVVVAASVRLVGVLFTQGINGLQTISNLVWNPSLQLEVNNENLHVLHDYIKRYQEAMAVQETIKAGSGHQEAQEIAMLYKKVQQALRDTKNLKNVHVLLCTSDLSRALVGVHGICCKSGKDRTAMAVTLEESRYIAYNWQATRARELCDVLRKRGARRQNVFANTGQVYYAFHELQQPLTPQCYRAPVGTLSGSVST